MSATSYEEIRDRIAAQLEPLFRAGKLRGWLDGVDTDMGRVPKKSTPPLWRLDDECAKRVRGLSEAFTVLLACPFAAHGWIHYEMNYPLREAKKEIHRTAADEARILRTEACGKAGVALARDVLLMAREGRWYRPRRGEEPTMAELRRDRGAA